METVSPKNDKWTRHSTHRQIRFKYIYPSIYPSIHPSIYLSNLKSYGQRDSWNVTVEVTTTIIISWDLAVVWCGHNACLVKKNTQSKLDHSFTVICSMTSRQNKSDWWGPSCAHCCAIICWNIYIIIQICVHCSVRVIVIILILLFEIAAV